MTRLRMIRYLGGYHGQPPELWPAPGETVEIEDENLIRELLKSKVAEELPEEKPKPVKLETTEKAPAENAAKRTTKPAARKREPK